MSRPRVTINDPRIPELLRVYAEGSNLARSAAAVGMSRDRARGILDAAGVLRVSKPWPEHRVEQLRMLRASGLSWSAIGEELCVPADRACKAHRKYVQCIPRNDRASNRDYSTRPPRPHTVIGPTTERPATLAQRVAAEVERLGAVVLLQHRGRFVTAVPGSAVAQAAEVERAVVGTYVEGVRTDWIADDIAGVHA